MGADRPKVEIIHVVIGGGIVLAAYRSTAADAAEFHRRCLTGVSVQSVALDDAPPELVPLGSTVHEVELLDKIPPEIAKDLEIEWDSDAEDITPLNPKKTTKDDFVPLTKPTRARTPSRPPRSRPLSKVPPAGRARTVRDMKPLARPVEKSADAPIDVDEIDDAKPDPDPKKK